MSIQFFPNIDHVHIDTPVGVGDALFPDLMENLVPGKGFSSSYFNMQHKVRLSP